MILALNSLAGYSMGCKLHREVFHDRRREIRFDQASDY